MAFLNLDMSNLLEQVHLDALQDAGYWTINDLCSADLMDVKRATNIKFHVLKDLVDNVKKRYTLPCHDLGFMVEKSIRECKICPTGLPELTSALDGGYQTQEIVEFFGDSECCKTELCYLLCGELLSHFEDYNILYVASDHDFDHEKVLKYTKSKAGNRFLDEDDLYKCLSRIDVARPTTFTQLTHLFNSLVHTDRKNSVKCVIIDSLSFIIQDDILDIKTADLSDGNELTRLSAYINRTTSQDVSANDLIDVYLREVMRLLINVAQTRNTIVVITNSETSLNLRKSWINAVDHQIKLSKIHDSSVFKVNNSRATVCMATIMKTIHNICRIGHSIPFAVDDEGLFAIRSIVKQECSNGEDSDAKLDCPD